MSATLLGAAIFVPIWSPLTPLSSVLTLDLVIGEGVVFLGLAFLVTALAFFVTALTLDDATALAIFDAVPAVIPAALIPFKPAFTTSDLELIPAAANFFAVASPTPGIAVNASMTFLLAFAMNLSLSWRRMNITVNYRRNHC